MLTTEESHEIESEAARYPRRDAVSIDALKIVQKRRGWVSDESLRDIAQPRHVADRSGRHCHVLQPDLPQAGRAPRHLGLRQRELLDHGLRTHARASPEATGHRAG